MSQATPPQPVRVLSFHAEYACRHSTACCTAPWAIALDERRSSRVATAVGSGSLPVPRATDGAWLARVEDSESASHVHLLRRDETGACVFLERQGGRCALHRACGHDALPEACQQFPRVTLVDDRGIHVTLSHYCPTVTALALDEPRGRVSIVAPAPGFARAPLVAGLDARGQWPPLLRPGVLCSPGAWSSWEAWVVEELGNATRPPWDALAAVARAADEVRAWRASEGEQDVFVARVLEDGHVGESNALADFDPVSLWQAAWSAVPPQRAAMPCVEFHTREWGRALDAAFAEVEAHGRAVGRYLAARAFASWCAYQGRGLRTHVASLRAALGVLVVEVAREFLVPADEGRLASSPAGRLPPLGRALRSADWLLVHLAEGETLARRWVEEE